MRQPFLLWCLGIVACSSAACAAEAADDRCSLAGTYWIQELDRLEVELACAVDALAPLPAGATFDPATATLQWTPQLDQAAVYELTADGTEGMVTVGVADFWDHQDNVLVADPLTYTHEFGLPVLFIDPAPESQDYGPATVTYGGHRWAAEGKLRGDSSLSFPKRSYLLRFDSQARFNDPEREFTHKQRVVVTTTFDDNSYLRQRLAYGLWNNLDPEHLQVQAYNAVVYLNGAYWGLYVLSDHVDGELMKAHGLWEDGNLYKAINHDANFSRTRNDGTPKQTLHDGYDKKEGPAEDYQDLDELVAFVSDSSDAEFAAGIGQRVDLRDYRDWNLFVVFTLADDSVGKNSYHYHNPNVGPWRYAPWDFNHSFGQSWTTERLAADDTSLYTHRNHLFDRALAIPELGTPWMGRFADALQNEYELTAVIALLDEWAAEIDASAHRDWARWEQAYRSFQRWDDRTDFTSYDQEVAYVRGWIQDRWPLLSELEQ